MNNLTPDRLPGLPTLRLMLKASVLGADKVFPSKTHSETFNPTKCGALRINIENSLL